MYTGTDLLFVEQSFHVLDFMMKFKFSSAISLVIHYWNTFENFDNSMAAYG